MYVVFDETTFIYLLIFSLVFNQTVFFYYSGLYYLLKNIYINYKNVYLVFNETN